MKETKIDARVAVVAVALGSIGGGLLGYVLARSRARREYAARLDKAVAEVKAHYSRPVIPRAPVIKLDEKRPRWADIVKTTVGEQPVRDDLEGLDDGSLDIEPGDQDPSDGGAGEGLAGGGGLPSLVGGDGLAEEKEPDGPFQITEAAFGELNDEGFQTISVTFFAGDKVLVDDKEDPIRDVLGTIGTANPKGFEPLGEDDPQIRYVRNRRLEVDFEILLDARTYTETVLGYGNPARRHEASPKATSAS